MSVIDIHWMGFLSNVDESILNVPFPEGFEIRFFDFQEGYEHLLSLNKLSTEHEFISNFSMNWKIYNTKEGRMYYLYRKEDKNIDFNSEGYLNDLLMYETESLYNVSIRYVLSILKILNDGDVRVPYHYSYYEYNNELHSLGTFFTNSHISAIPYHFNNEDIVTLKKLLEVDDVFKHGYIKLAYDNYEDSFESSGAILPFLSLMIAMEVLFNPGQGELTYRISRNAAVLLGKNLDASNIIFKNMKRLYGIRSKIVHSSKSDDLNEKDLNCLRKYVRCSILNLIILNKSKKQVLKKLNMLGFGGYNSNSY